jgi:Chitobiase/beta-hexosaminidase C-terminal domain
MSTGVLPWDDLVEKLLINTGFFETSQYTEDAQMYITSGNWDNAGLSVGNMQYNYGIADRASELFAYLLNNHDDVVRAVFGSYTAEYDKFREVNVTTYTRQQKVDWANTITDWAAPTNGHGLIAPWKDILGRLCQTTESKAKYRDMFNAYYLTNPLDLFKQMKCTSRAALASLLDLSINRGRYYPCNTLVWDFENIDADTTKDATAKEAAKIAAINDRGNDNTNGINVTTWVERRNCMRNQGGTYYGSTYDPETQFDINQEPAIAEKQAGFSNVNKLGEIPVQNLYLGNIPVKSLYLGANLIGNAELVDYLSSKVPTTQFRTNNNSYVGVSGSVSIAAGNKVWVDVTNWVACKTYYTTDGTEPDTTKARYTDGIVFNTGGTFTLKAKTYNMAGTAEATKTLTVTVAVAPTTTISPSATVQNSIPITVTLTSSETGATIKYKIGSNTTENTYTGPFTVTQSTSGVQSTNITITYWSVGASATETAKSITYNTAGAVAAQPVVTTTAGNGNVFLTWPASANATSYTIYKSTVSGQQGTMISASQYMTGTSYTDSGLTNGTTYYYTVIAANYGGSSVPSAQKASTPTATAQSYRYLKLQGFGTSTDLTTRLIEFEAFSGGTNRMTAATILSSDAPNNTGTAAQIKDGVFTTTANSYPLWWTATPNGNVVIDLLAAYPLDTLKWYGYSLSGDQRANRFRVLASNTNNGTDWVSIWDMSQNTTAQAILPAGFTKTLP